jgi:Mrp family chromosome partitioning ATPase
MLLSGRGHTYDIGTIRDLPNLSVLPAGDLPPNPQELLSRPNFAELLKQLGARYQLLIIDTPPASQYADALTTTMLAGAALLVLRKDHSRSLKTKSLTQKFARAHAKIIGMSVNQF